MKRTLKPFLKATLLSAALTSLTANAALFDFSYIFTDGTAITGSLQGNLNGATNLVDNISDVHVFFNGIAFTGAPLFHAAWNTATTSFDNTIAAFVSPDAALNNFIFADTNVPTDNASSNLFEFINDPNAGGQLVEALDANIDPVNIPTAFDSPANGSWSLTAAVPEPASLALLIAGLGLMGAATRRRT